MFRSRIEDACKAEVRFRGSLGDQERHDINENAGLDTS